MKAVNPLMHAIIFCVFRLTMMLGRPWRCCTWTCPNPNYLMLIVEVHVTEFAYAHSFHGFLFSLVMFWVYNIIHKTISDDRYGFHFL